MIAIPSVVRYAILSIGLLFSAEAFSQADASSAGYFGLEPGVHAVGFRLIETRDRSRGVAGVTGATHSRPMRVYVWYPSDRSEATPMRFGDYLALAERDIWPAEIAGALHEALQSSRRPLARSLPQEQYQTLSQQSMLAVEHAQSLAGPYPLIVFGQGLYYEYPVVFAALAEYLAGRGFVVASAPLLGTSSPIVRVDVLDLETQVRDLEFVIAEARQLPFVNAAKLGVLGFDMGGMAALVLAMRNPEVEALVTLDSGVLYPHPSGIPAASPHYDPTALRAAWLHAAPTDRGTPPEGFSEADSLFSRAVYCERYLLLSAITEHVDYTSYALIEDREAVLGYWDAGTAEAAAAHRRVAGYVRHFFSAYLDESAESLAELSRAPREEETGGEITIEHRAGMPPAMRYEEFVQALVGGRAEEAVEAVRSLAESEPDHVLLDDSYLWRISYHLLFAWDLAPEAAAVAELMVELYPESVDAKAILGEAYIAAENYSAAIEAYGRVLEQVPDDARTQARLEWLHSQNNDSDR